MIHVYDICGTLANIDHRLHLLPGNNIHCLKDATPEQIERFMNPVLVAQDKPIEAAVSHCRRMLMNGERVVFATARMEKLRWVTHGWLMKHVSPLYARCMLYMRGNDDMTPSRVLKRRFLFEINYAVVNNDRGISWYDDDMEVVQTLSKEPNVAAYYAPDVFQVSP